MKSINPFIQTLVPAPAPHNTLRPNVSQIKKLKWRH